MPRYVYCDHTRAAAAVPTLAGLGLGVEILFETTEDLWPQVRWENLLGLADVVTEAGLPASVHGPHHGLSLGSRDAHIRQYTLEVLSAALEFARAVRSPHMVIHTGFLPQYAPQARARWLEPFTAGLEILLQRAAELEVRLLIENTYETDTSLFEEIFRRFPTPALGMCFDVGHATCFGKVSPAEWSLHFSDRIAHLHCSDNDGRDDLHWCLGRGQVDFRGALLPLVKLHCPASVTFEVPVADAAAACDYFDHLMQTIGREEPS